MDDGWDEPEEVQSDLFRGSGANVTDFESKVPRLEQLFLRQGGWGSVPPITAVVTVVDQDDIDTFREYQEDGSEHELDWSRELTQDDLGREYAKVTDGHHRAWAAKFAGVPIRARWYRTNPKPQKKKRGWYPASGLIRDREAALKLAERYIDAMGGDRRQSDPGLSGLMEAAYAGTAGRVPSLEEMQRLYAAKGLSLSPEHYSHEIKHLALEVHKMIRWVNMGMPVFQLDPQTAGMLALTDVDRIDQGDILWPFDTFLIVLEPGTPIFVDDAGHVREVRTIWAHRWDTPDGEQRLYVQASAPAGSVSLPSVVRIVPGRPAADWFEELQREWGSGMTDVDRTTAAASLRLVASLALHVTHRGTKPSKPRHKFRRDKYEKLGLPLPQDWVVETIAMPAELQGEIRELGPRVMSKLSTRHVVRGHWRSQRFGAGRAQSKLVRIDPYWRGAGEGARSSVRSSNPGFGPRTLYRRRG